MEGWVDLGYPVVHRPGVELATFRSRVERPTKSRSRFMQESHPDSWETQPWSSCQLSGVAVLAPYRIVFTHHRTNEGNKSTDVKAARTPWILCAVDVSQEQELIGSFCWMPVAMCWMYSWYSSSFCTLKWWMMNEFGSFSDAKERLFQSVWPQFTQESLANAKVSARQCRHLATKF